MISGNGLQRVITSGSPYSDTSDIDQTVTVSCGISDKSEIVTLKAGETATIEF